MIIFNRKKEETERTYILREINTTRKELARIKTIYNMENQSAMINSHIYEICALEEKLAYLTSRLRIDENKEKNIMG
ncbi:MAG: hypothetical protein IKZ25_02755 [Clostridia bacterium]|nr:hypothetical protein [Clostridia bacterium]